MSENNRTFLKAFIESYKGFPCLWKIKSRDYSNRNKKNSAYESLVVLSKHYFEDANKRFVIQKIKVIRNSFRKELKKVMISIRSGAGSSDVYEPSLWYYNLLIFVADQEVPRKGISNVMYNQQSQDSDDLENDANDNEDIDENTEADDSKVDLQIIKTDLTADTEIDTPVKKRKVTKKANDTSTSAFVKVMSKETKVEDEYTLLGNIVAVKLRKMSEEQRLLAEYNINNILHKGLLNQLVVSTE